MTITYYGHSCFCVEIKGKKMVFDPFVSPNPLAKDIPVSSIETDYLCISHGHEDHLADAIAIANNTNANLIASFEVASWFEKQGVKNCHFVNHGGKLTTDFGNIKFVNAVHSSAMPDGSYGGNPGGFVIDSDQGAFYYAGDTALTMDMQLIGQQYRLDFAMLPIGDTFTMGIDDALIASDFIKCNKIIGMHYDTFPPIEIDKEEAKNKFKNRGKELILMEVGSKLEFSLV